MADEANRYLVRSTPAEGFHGVFRAGRRWDKEGTEIELVAQDEDPKPGEKEEVLRIGKKTFAAITGDPRISVVPKDGAAPAADAIAASLAELTAKHGALESEHAKALKDLEEARAEIADLRETIAALASDDGAPKGKAKGK